MSGPVIPGLVPMADDGTFSYLFSASSWAWSDPTAFPHRILQHLEYSGAALLIALVIAFPVGLLIGHTGRGAFLAISIGNAGRAVPTLGAVVLVIIIIGVGLTPVMISLVLLAIPAILTTTYAGIRAVSRATVDAARGVGMTEWQIVKDVEIPNALPIIFGGVRNAALQVVSTATIAAYVGEGGLGRYLFDGLKTRNYALVVGGGIVLAALAVVVDQLLALLQRATVSPGVDGRAVQGRRTSGARASGRPSSGAAGPADALSARAEAVDDKEPQPTT